MDGVLDRNLDPAVFVDENVFRFGTDGHNTMAGIRSKLAPYTIRIQPYRGIVKGFEYVIDVVKAETA